ncbi:MAG: FMN-binding protein, partial [Lachnospiraceae bacterium]|nr:FMN-binding protein [Lachnospiraceae bacterium]
MENCICVHGIRKQILQAVIAVLFLCLIVPLSYLSEVAEYQKRVKAATIKDIDISEVPDGVYLGEYNVDFIYARVEATVEDGRITELRLLEHRNELGGPAEVITDRILDEQKIDVDTVTGATNSSIVIKKAV